MSLRHKPCFLCCDPYVIHAAENPINAHQKIPVSFRYRTPSPKGLTFCPPLPPDCLQERPGSPPGGPRSRPPAVHAPSARTRPAANLGGRAARFIPPGPNRHHSATSSPPGKSSYRNATRLSCLRGGSVPRGQGQTFCHGMTQS